MLDDLPAQPESPSISIAFSFSAAVVRPPASRVNSTASSRIVVVGSPSNSSTTFARPSTATRSVRWSGPGQLDRDPASVRGSAQLPDDVAQARRDLGKRLLGRRPKQDVVVRPDTDRVADVLLMHPAVECPHTHEPAIGVWTHRRRRGFVPRSVVHRRQGLAPIGGDRTELLEHRAGRLVVKMSDPALVHRAHRGYARAAASTRPSRASGVGTPIRKDSVPIMCETTSCTRQPGRSVCRLPLLVGQPREQRVDVVPGAKQSVEHLTLIELGHSTMLSPPKSTPDCGRRAITSMR